MERVLIKAISYKAVHEAGLPYTTISQNHNLVQKEKKSALINVDSFINSVSNIDILPIWNT